MHNITQAHVQICSRFIKLAEKHEIEKKGEIKLKSPKHLQVCIIRLKVDIKHA